MNKVKNERIPKGFRMVSFHVKSLFTSLPFEITIDITLVQNYHRKEIETIFTKNKMKNLILLCTKYVHFTFINEIYIRNDGVAIGPLLDLIFATTFVVELENT